MRAPVWLHLPIYLRAGTAWCSAGGWAAEPGCDERMRAGMRAGMQAGMRRAARLPLSADPMVRRPGLRNAGRCIWRCLAQRAQWAGDGVLRCGGAEQRLQSPDSTLGLRLPVLPLLCSRSGSPCSRCRAPAQTPRAPGASRSLTPAATRLPSPRSVFIGFQCSKITGFPHCFLLFTQRHGNPWIPSISKTKGFPENFTLRNP